jgi:hypothetical protein
MLNTNDAPDSREPVMLKWIAGDIATARGLGQSTRRVIPLYRSLHPDDAPESQLPYVHLMTRSVAPRLLRCARRTGPVRF